MSAEIAFFVLERNRQMNRQNITVSPSGKVFLTLPGKDYKSKRCIGEIRDNGFHTLRNQNALFRGFNGSFGFNYELLRDYAFKYVIVSLSNGQTLETTRLHILKNGKFLHYQQNQLERQIFLPLSEFGLDKANESEKATPHLKQHPQQQSLFGGAL